MKWTKGRLKELDKLRELLREVSVMDHGSHVTRRIATCEKLATYLNQSNLNTGRASFVRFLESLAIAERQSAAEDGGKK